MMRVQSRLLATLIFMQAGAASVCAHAGETPTPPPRPSSVEPPSNAPTPPPRPADMTPAAPAMPAAVTPAAPAAVTPAISAPAPEPACARALASGRIVATSVAPVTGPGDCGIAAPVRLTAIVLADGRRIPIEPAPLLRCDVAEAIGDWVREDLAPLADRSGGGLAKILGSEGYECRGRNGVAGAIPSEHGRGNAFDLRGFTSGDGKSLLVERQTEAPEFMELLRRSGCARFTTVLGPGSDGFHETHMHVDLEARRNGYRICQWELKQ